MRALTILLLYFACASCKLPHYIKPCARNDPDYIACAKRHANENIKELVKGDRKNNIPVLDPLEIKEMKIDAKGFHIVNRDIVVKGFKDLLVTKISYDFNNQHYAITFKVPRMEILSNYQVSGKILILPITGKGRLNCTLIDEDVEVTGRFTFVMIDGKKYFHTERPDNIEVDTKRMYMKFSNLFNGNKLLEDEMNKFLNDEWRSVFDELGKPAAGATVDVIVEIINRIQRIAPYDEMFPETLPRRYVRACAE